MSRRVMTLVGIAIAMSMLVACGGEGEGGRKATPSPTRPPDAATVLRDAVAAVKQDRTGRYSVRSAHNFGDFGSDGSYDLAAGAQKLDLSYEDEGKYWVLHRRTVDGQTFVQYERTGGSGPACWVDVSGDRYFDPPKAGKVSAITMLDSLRAISLAKNGIDVEATVPVGSLEQIMFGTFGPASEAEPAAFLLAKASDHRVPVQVRVVDGRVASIAVDLGEVVSNLTRAKIDVQEVLDDPEYLEKYLISVTVKYFELGGTVDVARPDADQIGVDFDAKCSG